jgi:hypothetical protein
VMRPCTAHRRFPVSKMKIDTGIVRLLKVFGTAAPNQISLQALQHALLNFSHQCDYSVLDNVGFVLD